MTAQKIYAVLRKAGHAAAKWEASGMVRGWGEWRAGVRVQKDSDTFNITYKVSRGAESEARAHNMMHTSIVPALEAAGVKGEWQDHVTWRVSE